MEEQKKKIGIGFRFGKLTVSADTGKRKNGYTIWRCDCDCGGSIELDTRTIQRGTYKDCGCETRVTPGARDLTGMRFGKLVAISPTKERKYGTTVWQCVCDCDKVAYVPARQLLSGYVKSCGCLSHPPLKDLVGKRFGKLTALSYVEKREGQHYWLCRCDCGNETVVRQNYLQRGHTTSCGCVQAEIFRKNLKLVDGTSVTRLEAGKKHLISSNTSGYTGVYLQKKTGKWAAQITFRGKTYFLGVYDKIEDAIKARKRGEEMHDDFLEWYYREYAERKKHPKPDTVEKTGCDLADKSGMDSMNSGAARYYQMSTERISAGAQQKTIWQDQESQLCDPVPGNSVGGLRK